MPGCVWSKEVFVEGGGKNFAEYGLGWVAGINGRGPAKERNAVSNVATKEKAWKQPKCGIFLLV